jgi:hypothetical protein
LTGKSVRIGFFHNPKDMLENGAYIPVAIEKIVTWANPVR